MSLIEVRNLYKVFGSKPKRAIPKLEQGVSKDTILKNLKLGVGVNNASFSIEKGEIFVIMGLSGSGKSTLLRCFNRIHEATSGEILVDGKDILQVEQNELREYRRHFFSMVFQHFALFPHRSVRENVEYGLKIQGIDDETKKKKAYEMLEIVGLKGYEEKMPHELSGGMQQRVGLARALANEPEVLLMDEAFSALDPLIRKEMQEELLNLQSSLQKTIIFITHDLDEALKIGDRIAIMKDGEIVQIDTPENILKYPANDYVREFVQDVNRSKVITAASIMRKPKYLAKEHAEPSTVIREMSKEDLETAFVVDKNRKLSGYINIEDATALVRNNEKSISSVIQKANTITPETLIDDLLPDIINSPYHLAVIDNEGRLLGHVGKTAILTGILGEENCNV